MNILSIPRFIFNQDDGWLDLEKSAPSMADMLLYVVLPLSVLPPLLLYFAGSHYGDVFANGYGGKPWGTIAIVFFLAEILTFVGMGWFIRQVAATQDAKISTHDAYMVASISPTPLWLSSLALMVPSLAFNTITVLTALVMSCSLIYHGIYALCHLGEEATAAAITHPVMGAGVSAWALLLLIIVAL